MAIDFSRAEFYQDQTTGEPLALAERRAAGVDFSSPEFYVEPSPGVLPQINDALGRFGGAASRGFIDALVGIPGMVADPFLEKAGLPTTREGINQLYQQFPTLFPPSGGAKWEQTTQQLAGAGMGGVMGAGLLHQLAKAAQASPLLQRVADTMLKSRLPGVQEAGQITQAIPPVLSQMAAEPVTQAGAAAAGAYAANKASDLGLSENWQKGAAMVGGLLATTGIKVTGGVVKPAFEEGRRRVVGWALNNLATNPSGAIRSLEATTPRVPGYQPFSGPASRDPGLLALQNTVRSMDPGAFGWQDVQNNQAIWRHLERVMPRTSESLRELRDQFLTRSGDDLLPQRLRGQPNVLARLSANAQAVNPMPLLDDLARLGEANRFKDELSRSGLARIMREFDAHVTSEVGNDGTTLWNYTKLTDPRLLYDGPRKTISDMVTKKYDPVGNRPLQNNEIALYKQALRLIDDKIEEGMPGFREEYLRPYSRLSAAASRAQSMEGLTTKGSATASFMPGENDTIQAIVQPGRWNQAVKEMRKTREYRGLTNAQRAAVEDVGHELKRGAMVAVGKVAGSDTYKNLSMANLIGRLTGAEIGKGAPKWVQQFGGWLMAFPEREIQSLLSSAMRDPKLAAQLMRLATEKEAETFAQEMAKRAPAFFYGVTDE